MFTLERRVEIMRILGEEKRVAIGDLAGRFYTSEATIRRDLAKLEQQGQIKRTYGGAVLLEGLGSEIPFEIRHRERMAEKDRIGELAAGTVRSSDTIILDSSTTAYAMVRHLRGIENLTVITNSLKAALALGELHQNVYCCGGKLRENAYSLGGSHVEQFIQGYNVKKLFFSCRAVSEQGGVMDFSDEDASLKQVMIRRAEEVTLLCDHAKIGRRALRSIGGFPLIHNFVTDRKPPEALLESLQLAGVRVIYPQP